MKTNKQTIKNRYKIITKNSEFQILGVGGVVPRRRLIRRLCLGKRLLEWSRSWFPIRCEGWWSFLRGWVFLGPGRREVVLSILTRRGMLQWLLQCVHKYRSGIDQVGIYLFDWFLKKTDRRNQNGKICIFRHLKKLLSVKKNVFSIRFLFQ